MNQVQVRITGLDHDVENIKFNKNKTNQNMNMQELLDSIKKSKPMYENKSKTQKTFSTKITARISLTKELDAY